MKNLQLFAVFLAVILFFWGWFLIVQHKAELRHHLHKLQQQANVAATL